MFRAFAFLMKVVNALCEWVACVMLVAMTLLIMFQVVCRSVGAGFDFTEELARYLFVAIVMLGTAIGVYQGGNIGIEALVKRLPAPLRKAVVILGDLCCILLFVEMTRYAWRALPIVGRQRSSTMGFPMSYPYSAVFIASAIILFYLFVHLLRILYNRGGEDGGGETA